MQLVQVGVMVAQYLLVVAAQKENRYAGTLVGGAAHMGQHLYEHQACAYGAGSVLEAGDMPVLESGHHLIDYFFKRLYAPCHSFIAVGEGFHGEVDYFGKCGGEYLKLPLCGFRESMSVRYEAGAKVVYVCCVIAYALKVGDGLKQEIQFVVVLSAVNVVGELYKVVLCGIGKAVQPVLHRGDLCAALRIVGYELVYASVEVFAGEPAHAGFSYIHLMKGEGGGYEQLLVQSAHFRIGFLGIVRGVFYDDRSQPYKLVCEGKQHQRRHQIEYGGEVCYSAAVHRFAPYEVQCPGVVQQGYGYHKQHCADTVE